jgi:hypothetical protein
MLNPNVRAYSCFLSLITLCASASLSCRAHISIAINPMATRENKDPISFMLFLQHDLQDRTCLPFRLSRVRWIFLANRAMVSSNPACTPCMTASHRGKFIGAGME